MLTRRDPDIRAVQAKGFPSLAVKVIGVAAGLAGSVLLGRTIGADGLGVVMLALTIVQVVAMPARVGLDQMAMRWVATYRDTGDLLSLDRLLAGVTVATVAAGGWRPSR